MNIRWMQKVAGRLALASIAALTMAGAAAAQGAAPAEAQGTSAATQRITLTAGRSTVLPTDFDITRIAVTDPAIANAMVVQPRAVLIDGKAPGTISLIVWGADMNRQFDIVVEPGVSTLQMRLQNLFPGEPIVVSTNDEAIILSGKVSSNSVSLRAAEIAAATSAKTKVVNLLQLPGGTGSQQVMLQVRFAEVSRRAMTELGVSLFTSPTGVKNTIGRTTTQQFAAPGFDSLEYTKRNGSFGSSVTGASGEFTFSDFLNIFLFSEKYDLGAMIRALQGKGLFQSLAEPNLIAYNGQEASFLAGGQFPVPVVQGITNAVTIQWKEYGVRLRFTPTIAGDVIRLKVEPEVSSLDFGNAILLNGFRIPSISTRRAATEVELRDGQSFAVAGLIDNVLEEQFKQVPGLAHIPVLGYLFKSKANQVDRTELMVLITPKLVRPLNPGEVPPLPARPKGFLPPLEGVGEQLQGGGGASDAPPVATPDGGQR
jgi:pilus assembly protein CpaC